MSVRILLIDADEPQRGNQRIELSAMGWDIAEASDARQALTMIQAAPPDVICCDVGVPGTKGPSFALEIAQRTPEATVLVTFAPEDRARAIETAQRGVFDILEKPLQREELQIRVNNAHARTQQNRQNHFLGRELDRSVAEHPIVAASASMIELLENLERAASHRKAVLLAGETGTGKELLARAIHAQSQRRNQNFVTVNCGTRPTGQLAVQLFGGGLSVSSAGTRIRSGLFTNADCGTLFLDQIDQLPEPIQAQLAELLDEDQPRPKAPQSKRTPDVRVIASTNEDLEKALASGHFRKDLYSRICEVRLDAPPLRERQKDIPLLVDHFLERYRLILAKPVRGIADDALERLVAYQWPGNIRELENVCERAMILARRNRITTQDLPRDILSPTTEAEKHEEDLGLKRRRRAMEIELIRRALRATGGNRTHAAKRLEISHRALLYKIKEYGIRD